MLPFSASYCSFTPFLRKNIIKLFCCCYCYARNRVFEYWYIFVSYLFTIFMRKCSKSLGSNSKRFSQFSGKQIFGYSLSTGCIQHQTCLLRNTIVLKYYTCSEMYVQFSNYHHLLQIFDLGHPVDFPIKVPSPV